METKTCVKCGETKNLIKFHKRIINGKENYRNECFTCRGRKDRAQLKLDAINALGNKCNCCGQNHPYFLSLDHIKNDGNKHREQYNEQQIYREARREGWPKDKYQLLCMNCNFAKGHFDECPHKLGITAEQALIDLEFMAGGIGRKFVKVNTSNLPEARQKLAMNRLEYMTSKLTQEEIEQLKKLL